MPLTVLRSLSEPGDRRPSGLRRLLIALALGLAMAPAGPTPAPARDVTAAAGRTVAVPDAPARVFAAAPPASELLYALAPKRMVGWVRAPHEGDLPNLLPSTHDLQELGRMTGRGGTVNLEARLAAQPDLIVDFGMVNPTSIDLADSVAAQTGVPCNVIDGSFENTPAAIRMLADVLGVAGRGEALATYTEAALARVDAALPEVPPDARPRAYLGRGPEGLEAPARGSIKAEIVERVGAVNVVEAETRGLVTPSLEQVIARAPDTIVTVDRAFAGGVGARTDWRAVPAMAQGRVFQAPFTALDAALMARAAQPRLFARPGAGDRAVAIAALERPGLGRLAHRPVTELPGGRRQLAGVAASAICGITGAAPQARAAGSRTLARRPSRRR